MKTHEWHFKLRFYQLNSTSYNYFRSTAGFTGRQVVSGVGQRRKLNLISLNEISPKIYEKLFEIVSLSALHPQL
jgi:hypothetical protein